MLVSSATLCSLSVHLPKLSLDDGGLRWSYRLHRHGVAACQSGSSSRRPCFRVLDRLAAGPLSYKIKDWYCQRSSLTDWILVLSLHAAVRSALPTLFLYCSMRGSSRLAA